MRTGAFSRLRTFFRLTCVEHTKNVYETLNHHDSKDVRVRNFRAARFVQNYVSYETHERLNYLNIKRIEKLKHRICRCKASVGLTTEENLNIGLIDLAASP